MTGVLGKDRLWFREPERGRVDMPSRRIKHSQALLLSACLGWLGSASPAHGELVYFRGGFSIQAPATIVGDRVVLTLPTGKAEFPRSFVLKVVPGFWPETEWPERLRRAGNDFKPRFDAVWWAIENGFTLEVEPELRRLHTLDPAHPATTRMVKVLDRLKRPTTDPEFERFQKSLGVECKVARGPHVLLLHEHSDPEADERIAMLEHVIAGYYLVFAAAGIELVVPEKRLTSAWFASQDDYLAFLKREDAAAFMTTRGYYHPTWNAVVTFDARSTKDDQAHRAALARRRDELAAAREHLRTAPPRSRIRFQIAGDKPRAVSREEGLRRLDQLTAEADLREVLLELDRRAIDLGTAAHEMTHQLAVASGLAPRYDAFPRWLHEGLAAQFEVIRGGRWAGVSRAHDLRLPNWRRLAAPPLLDRLVRDGGFAHGYDRDHYAQAWALVYFLRTQKPTEFLTFLDLLRSPPPLESAALPLADRAFTAFGRALGPDLKSLEHDWVDFINHAQTPLEQHAPPDAPKP